MTFPAKTDFTFKHVGQAPYPQQTTLQTQTNLDARGIELLQYINSVISAYASTTAGDGGAKNIGLESIVGIDGNDLQSALVSIKATIDGMVLGVIPPGSVGVAQLNFDPATQAELDASSALITAITNSLNTTNSTMTTHKADYVRQPGYGVSAGSANAYTLTLVPPLASLVDGASAYINIHANNTDVSTLNWDGTGVKSIVDSKGNALIVGKLKANGIVGVRYNASTSSFQLLGEGGDYGTAGQPQVLTGYTIGTDAGLIAGTMPNKSSSWQPGSFIGFDTNAGVLLQPPTGYYDGGVNSYVGYKDPNHIPANIIAGITVMGVLGTAINGAGMKRVANGSGTTASDGTVTVTGLSFSPSKVYITAYNGSIYYECSKDSDVTILNGDLAVPHQVASYPGYAMTTAISSTADGFTCKFSASCNVGSRTFTYSCRE